MSDLRMVEKMLAALLRHHGLLQWVDCWAAGENEGGVYVSLFNSRAKFRLCAVYPEQQHKLPAFVRENLPRHPGGDISTERERVAKAGHLRTCAPFAITRYSLSHGDDLKWRFGDVLWVLEQKQTATVGASQVAPQAPAAPRPGPRNARAPLFGNVKDALEWAVAQGAFGDYEAARQSYETQKRYVQPKTAGEMYAAWIGYVRKLARRGEMEREAK